MSSRSKRRSFAECALPPELGCPPSPRPWHAFPIRRKSITTVNAEVTNLKKAPLSCARIAGSNPTAPQGQAVGQYDVSRWMTLRPISPLRRLVPCSIDPAFVPPL
jgi:hypothetical protein